LKGVKNCKAPLAEGYSPQFLTHVRCGQMAGWIKMPLGIEVGLCPGDIVSHGNPDPPPKKGHSPPIFCPCLFGETTRWIKMTLAKEVYAPALPTVLDWGASSSSQRSTAPNFLPMSVVAKRLDGSKYHLVELVPSHTVLDGDPAPPKRAQQPPHFGPCLLWPNGRPSSGFQVQCSKFCR